MLRTLLTTTVDDRPDDEWNADLAAEHVRPVCGLIDDRVGGEEHEVHPRMHDDRAHAGESGADGGARRCVFRNGRIENSVAPETAIEILHRRADVPRAPEPLPHDEHTRVCREQLLEGLADCLRVREFSGHTNMCVSSSVSVGSGELRATRTASSISASAAFSTSSKKWLSPPCVMIVWAARRIGSAGSQSSSSARRFTPTSWS